MLALQDLLELVKPELKVQRTDLVNIVWLIFAIDLVRVWIISKLIFVDVDPTKVALELGIFILSTNKCAG